MLNRSLIVAAALALVARQAMPVPKLASFTPQPLYVLPRPPFGVRAAKRAASKAHNRARNKRAHRGGRYD